MSTDNNQHHRRIGELEDELLKALKRIAELESEAAELEKAAHEDHLTSVFNRRGFNLRLEAIEAVIKRFPERFKYQKPYFMAIDLDHFKKINDQFGHPTGDEVLRQFSQLLRSGVRGYDIIGRWGGEEFVVALIDISPGEAKNKAESLADTVRRFKFAQAINVTASFGLAETLENADKALYQAKHNGRDQVVQL